MYCKVAIGYNPTRVALGQLLMLVALDRESHRAGGGVTHAAPSKYHDENVSLAFIYTKYGEPIVIMAFRRAMQKALCLTPPGMGWPQSWAECRLLKGTLSQNTGASRAIGSARADPAKTASHPRLGRFT